MRTEQLHAPANSGSPFDIGIFARLAAAWTAFFDAREHYRAVRELRRLDHRLLADIGIDRDQIEHATWHGRLEG